MVWQKWSLRPVSRFSLAAQASENKRENCLMRIGQWIMVAMTGFQLREGKARNILYVKTV
jgi:hypothetical protein